MNRSYRGSLLTTLAAFGAGLISIAAALPVAAQTVTINHVRTYQTPPLSGTPDPNNLMIVGFDPTFQDGANIQGFFDYVGAQTITLTGPGAPAGSYQAYCVDLPGEVGTTSYSGTFAHASTLSTANPSVAGSVRGGAIAWLLNNTTVSSDLDSAAMQLCIWEVEYDWDGHTFASLAADPSLDFFSGNFQFGAMQNGSIPTAVSILTTAINFLKNWGGQTASDALLLKTTEVSSPGSGAPAVLRQALITNVPVPVTTPEPGTLPLLAAGAPILVGIAGRARRRQCRAA